MNSTFSLSWSAIPKKWALLWLLWGGLGAGLLIVIDRDWVGAISWLGIGFVIGMLAPRLRFLSRPFYDSIEGQCFVRRSDDPEALTRRALGTAGLMIPPLFALFYGTLIGPFLGVISTWGTPHLARLSAISGLVLWTTLLTVLAAIATAIMLPRVTGPAYDGPPRWMFFISPLRLIPAVWHCVRVLVRLPRVRKMISEFEQRGAVFGRDEVSVYGIDFRRGEFGDQDLKPLRHCMEIDHLRLAGTRISDAGLRYLVGLSRLTYLDLSGTAITDAAEETLGQLSNLQYLVLRETAVTEEVVSRLRQKLPGCRFSTSRV